MTFLGCQPVERPVIQTADLTKSLIGTWRWSPGGPGSDDGLRIDLSTNGLWKAWPLQQDSLAPASLGGPWFVHDRILVLRVQGTNNGHLPPGTALTFNVETVTARLVKMSSLLEPDPITLERLVQPGAAPNAAPPHR